MVGRRKCGPKIGKRVIAAGSSKIRISLNPQNQQRFTAVETGHDISLLSHPTQALRYFVSLLFKVYGLLGVVQLESLSSLLISPLTVYQHTVNIGFPFFETNSVNSKPDLLATSQSFTDQTKQSDENRRVKLLILVSGSGETGALVFLRHNNPELARRTCLA